jgi:anti-sigma factor RsiW
MECRIPGHADCQELFGRLSDYIDGELEPFISSEVEAHLSECLACQACVKTLMRTVAICRRAGESPMPEGFSEKLHALLRTRVQTDKRTY